MPKDTNRIRKEPVENNEEKILVYNQDWMKKIQYPNNEELQKLYQTPTDAKYSGYEFQDGFIN